MPRFGANGISRKLTIVAASGVLCVATVGASAAADSWFVTGSTTSVVRAADVLILRPVSGDHAVRSATLNSRQAVSSRQARSSVTKQALSMETARRAAAAHFESVETAAAARRAAARAAAARAAAKRAAAAAAARQAAQQAAEQQAARNAAAAQATATQPAATPQGPPPAPAGAPQQIAQQMLGQYGWSGQFSCLDSLWTLESGWNIYAQNPTTGAYGIPQALPGSKMASAGPDWQSDPATQIRWGLNYIQGSYGSPCAAWSHEEADGWY